MKSPTEQNTYRALMSRFCGLIMSAKVRVWACLGFGLSCSKLNNQGTNMTIFKHLALKNGQFYVSVKSMISGILSNPQRQAGDIHY
jgi:hypothetical protein